MAQLIQSYVPYTGFGPTIDFDALQDFAKVVAILGKPEFYVIYAQNQSQVWGKRFFQGAYDPAVLVSAGLPTGFYPDTSLSASPDVRCMQLLSTWGSGNPQQYWTSCTGFTASDSTAPVFNGPVYDDGVTTDVASFLHVVASGAIGNWSSSL